MDMFRAGSDLKNKTPEEIFYQDFKKFEVGEVEFAVGQITSLSANELTEIKGRLIPYMEKACKDHRMDMVFSC